MPRSVYRNTGDQVKKKKVEIPWGRAICLHISHNGILNEFIWDSAGNRKHGPEPNFHGCKSSVFPLFSPVSLFPFRVSYFLFSWLLKPKILLQQSLSNMTGICWEQTSQSPTVWWGYIVMHRSQSELLDPVLFLSEVAVYTWEPLMLRYGFSIIIIIQTRALLLRFVIVAFMCDHNQAQAEYKNTACCR